MISFVRTLTVHLTALWIASCGAFRFGVVRSTENIFFLPSLFSTDDKVSRFPKLSFVLLAFSRGVFAVRLEGL